MTKYLTLEYQNENMINRVDSSSTLHCCVVGSKYKKNVVSLRNSVWNNDVSFGGLQDLMQPEESKGEERNVETGMTTVRASERETSTAE